MKPIKDKVSTQVWRQVGAQVSNQVRVQVLNQVWDKLEKKMIDKHIKRRYSYFVTEVIASERPKGQCPNRDIARQLLLCQHTTLLR